MVQLITKLLEVLLHILRYFEKRRLRKEPPQAVPTDKQHQVAQRMYELLVSATDAVGDFVSLFDAAGSPSKQEKEETARNALNEFTRFYRTRDFQLPEQIDVSFTELIRVLRDAYYRFELVSCHTCYVR